MSSSTPDRFVPGEIHATAARDFVRIVLHRLRSDDGVHAETAITGTAGMAGHYLLRSFGIPFAGREAGSAIAEAEAAAQVPALDAALLSSLADLGIAVDPDGIPARAPEVHAPRLSLIQLQMSIGTPIRQTVRRQAISERDAAFAGALACAQIIKDCSPVLDPAIAVAVARSAFMVGASTVPIYLPGDDTPEADLRKPWYKFW